MTPTFQGEVQLRRWSESSTQGVQVTFALPDSDDLEPFKAKAGKRFMAVLVEIGDDEKPVEAQPKAEEAGIGPLCALAVKWCKTTHFFEWIAPVFDRFQGGSVESAHGISKASATAASREEFCRAAVLTMCDVESRKELDTNPEAAEKFHRLIRGPFYKHAMAKGLA